MNDFLELIKTRRSIRRFLDEPVAQEDVMKMLEAAHFAPSASNSLPWRFVVIRDGKLLDRMSQTIRDFLEPFAEKMTEDEAGRLRSYLHYYTFFNQAPVVIAVLGMAYSSRTTALLSKYGELPEAQVVDAGQQSLGACIQNLLLAAHALGYGTCWMTGPMVVQAELESLLDVAEPWHVVALIPVGRPAVDPTPPPRTDLDEIVTVIEPGATP